MNIHNGLHVLERRIVLFAVGMVLAMSFGVQIAAADGPVVHVVTYGETLSAISRKYDVPLGTLLSLNRLSVGGYIFPGQRIALPAPAPVAAAQPEILRLTGVPLLKQRQTLTCEEAAAAMASRGRISEAQLVRVMPRSANPFEGIRGRTNAPIWGSLVDYGTYAQAVQVGLNRLGLSSTVYYGQSYNGFKAAIVAQLKAGRPVIWWTTYHEQRQRPVSVGLPNGKYVRLVRFEHTVTIVGMTASGFLYHDPQDATVRFVSFANYQRASSYFGNMALVITN